MAALNAARMVVKTPQGLEVKARRQVPDQATFDKLIEAITNQLQGQSVGTPTISDLDLSQNKLSYDNWEALFSTLDSLQCRVIRFRLFGCPTLNDDVAILLGDFLRLLTPEKAPTEMHLSDCAMTSVGFQAIVGAVEDTEVYPLQASGRPTALYMRLENNFIAEEVIKEKVDTGLIKAFKKGPGAKGGGPDGFKIDLVVVQSGSFQQKSGDPPAPEDAPAPKNVSDGRWRGSSQGPPLAAGGTIRAPIAGRPIQGGAIPAWQQAGQRGRMSSLPPQGVMKNNGRGVLPNRAMIGQLKPIRQQGAPIQQGRLQAPPAGRAGPGPAAVRARNGTTSADRSRTPAGRMANGGAAPAAGGRPGPPPPRKAALPKPWEEHWSDEYKIPYFWNTQTGESRWERPRA